MIFKPWRRNMPDNISIGKKGEDEALKVLKKNGYRIIERNYRCRYGEVDIIAQDGDTMVFVEVKTRGSDRFGPPQQSVDLRKQRHIISVSQTYLAHRGPADCPVRFDVVSIELRDGRYSTEIIRDAFGDEG